MSLSAPPWLLVHHQHHHFSLSLFDPDPAQHAHQPRHRPLSAPSLLQLPLPSSFPDIARLATLASLASQHHSSEYNLARHAPYSPDPAPMYIPLSVRRPERILQLQERQAQAEATEWYFPAFPSSALPSVAAAAAVPESSKPQPSHRQSGPSVLVSGKPGWLDEPLGLRAPPPSPAAGADALSEGFAALSLDGQRLAVHSSRPRSVHTHVHVHAHGRRAGQPCSGGCCKPLPGLPPCVKTSESHPISTSMLIPKHIMPLVASHISALHTLNLHNNDFHAFPLRLSPHSHLLRLLQTTLHPPPGTRIPHTALGNLHLSSCPGKKVRLTGGSDGRGAISRDLDTDLARFKDAGIGCVIWYVSLSLHLCWRGAEGDSCLDDTELALLGVPFPAYQRTLSHLGISLIRIPIAEGLAPLSPSLLYSRLEPVIREYTLRGVEVLVHCRGGVGRAGVVAGGWALMLGLVPLPAHYGSAVHVHSGAPAQSPYPDFAARADEPTSLEARREEEAELTCVRELVHLLRLRRSSKAVETYEQVAFLLEFVRFLSAKRHTEGQPAFL
ncbi:hypothetical protein CALVIDRAFT_366704 [Calocera viscosa TUFC12733]|uniref:Tyrosine specific protein phosphatases domain-containing protein n=1 Tax=Calocera viscosa (strain TUFC12733) TaxID=1330018 RepID=A0A167H176_CALVF|nr:hypothetical protein CALVIDRAFT_366704 [Calocera viscosa TUFC12733]